MDSQSIVGPSSNETTVFLNLCDEFDLQGVFSKLLLVINWIQTLMELQVIFRSYLCLKISYLLEVLKWISKNG